MPRKQRQEVQNGVFHVFAHSVGNEHLFRDTTDRRAYLTLLARTVRRQSWRLLSYCLMTTHVHLLVQTPHANLGSGMERFHGPYAQAFNRRHGRRGHVFERRYGAVLVTTDAYLGTVVRYIARNPVTPGIVEDATSWPWSSHRAVLDPADSPAWLDRRRLLELLTTWSSDPLDHYRAITAT